MPKVKVDITLPLVDAAAVRKFAADYPKAALGQVELTNSDREKGSFQGDALASVDFDLARALICKCKYACTSTTTGVDYCSAIVVLTVAGIGHDRP